LAETFSFIIILKVGWQLKPRLYKENLPTQVSRRIYWTLPMLRDEDLIIYTSVGWVEALVTESLFAVGVSLP
jgi:hypothetical protein